MFTRAFRISIAAAILIVALASLGPAQSIDRDYGDYNRAKVDRYLDVEIWTDRYDGEYYEGDNIVIQFRVNRDAFVVIYSIDTRGRVNLLYPEDEGTDNFVYGGVTNSLPGPDDRYDLTVSGPEGFENIQIIASRERFPIPDWYRNSGLICEWDDRMEFMDDLNEAHFVRYGGQRFAYDRAAIYVNEWEEDYYRPVYWPRYNSWTVYGNCYIDYPWGSTVYVNGIYWGCAPLYVPRIAIGWHTVTIYDYRGWCWESDFHVSRYNTVVFNHTIINTSSGTKSKYKEVRAVGYRDPVKHGYPNYKVAKKATSKASVSGKLSRTGSGASSKTVASNFKSPPKKYVRGSAELVKTDRGYETDASSATFVTKKRSSKIGSTQRSQNKTSATNSTRSSQKGKSGSYQKSDANDNSNRGSTGGSYDRSSGKSSKQKSESSDYYQKKSSSKSSGRSTKATSKSTNRDKGESSKRIKQSSDKRDRGSSREKSVAPKSRNSERKSSGKVKQESKKSPTPKSQAPKVKSAPKQAPEKKAAPTNEKKTSGVSKKKGRR
ncbi:MAG: hypothetical protein DRP45_05130 [Candidatus Zixiibacteriota bacterium]|nr:MAG: hypothetical protein DRP45_05130 [candidate division Zixibacteria bacterium]